MKELWFGSNEIAIEVLSRLPIKTLLSLKCVSKEWYHLISDRSFIQLLLKRIEPVSGFFFQERFLWCDVDIESLSYIPVETGSEVLRTVLHFLPEHVVILAVSNGLICCRSCFPSPHPVIYVCNPAIKKWVSLQWPTSDKISNLALAFDPVRDPIGVSTNFKVVGVRQTVTDMEETEMKRSYFSFDVYSSDTRTWRTSMEICQCDHNLIRNKSICIGCVLYWLTDGDQVLMFDFENDLCWLLRVPLPAEQFNSIPEMCIGESEKQLHYILISEDGLQVWVLEDYLESKWALKYSISLYEMEEENGKFLCNIQQRISSRLIGDTIPWMEPLAFKDELLFMRVSAKIYLYYFETKNMEELCPLSLLGSNSMVSPTVLPYSMSLVPLGQQ